MNRFVSAVVLLALLAVPSLASAQERGQVGVAMGIPTSLGLVWHATDRLAIRPEIGFTRSTSEVESSLFLDDAAESTNSTVSMGVSALWYLRPAQDHVRPYLSPRLAWSRASSESGDSDGPESDAWSIAGSFGIQYAPVRAFSIVGEVGLARASSESTFVSGPITGTTKSSSWSTRSSVGVVFYFR